MDEPRFGGPDHARFSRALAPGETAGGIGTLREKSVHAALKRYYEEFSDSYEVRVGGFVADIVGESGIIEIQTGSFSRLKKKLGAFLEAARVTVVYPVARVKWLVWLDPETGEITNRRKSPRAGSIYDVIPELFSIRDYLQNENFRVCLAMLELEEVRLLCGWSRDRKRGSRRHERVPIRLLEEITAGGPCGYGVFLPPGLPSPFTSGDFAECAKISRDLAGRTLNLLTRLGAVRRAGKKANAYLYETEIDSGARNA